jgi:hypothetical protein
VTGRDREAQNRNWPEPGVQQEMAGNGASSGSTQLDDDRTKDGCRDRDCQQEQEGQLLRRVAKLEAVDEDPASTEANLGRRKHPRFAQPGCNRPVKGAI